MNTILRNRPTAVIGTIATIVLVALAKLVAAGVVSAAFAKSWGPWIVLIVVAGFFLLVWLNVTPAVKLDQTLADHQAEVEKYAAQLDNGRLPEADLARVRGEFEDAATQIISAIHPVLNVLPADLHLTGDQHPDATAVGAPVLPTGQAGAPPQPPLVTGVAANVSPSGSAVPVAAVEAPATAFEAATTG